MRRVLIGLCCICLFCAWKGWQGGGMRRAIIQIAELAWTELDYMEYATSLTASNTYISSDGTRTYNASSSIPAMTAINLPSPYYATNSGNLANYPAWQAFDQKTSGNYEWIDDTTTGWIQIDVGTNNTKTITKYTLTSGPDTDVAGGPRAHQLIGSNYGSRVVLDSRWESTWAVSTAKSYVLTNQTGYRYYILNVLTNHTGSSYVGCQELDLFETASEGNLVAYSEPTIKSQGSYSLKAIAAADSSSNDTMTRILSPTTNLTSVTNINIDLYSSRTNNNISFILTNTNGITMTNTPVLAAGTENSWQSFQWNIADIADTNKQGITNIIIKVIHAGSANTFYVDNLKWLK